MEALQMLRRKAEKRMVELSPDEARLLRGALLAFRNKASFCRKTDRGCERADHQGDEMR